MEELKRIFTHQNFWNKYNFLNQSELANLKKDTWGCIEEIIIPRLSRPVQAGVSLQKAEDEDYKKVFGIYGQTHTIIKRVGTKVDMTKLKDNESVCYGDGETYHFLLRKKC